MAVTYPASLIVSQNYKLSTTLVHLLVFEVVGIASFIINSELDEMAGMLFVLIPLAILIIVLMGRTTLMVKKQFNKKKNDKE